MRKRQVLGVLKGAIKERILCLNQTRGVVEFIQRLPKGFSILANFLQHNPIFRPVLRYFL